MYRQDRQNMNAYRIVLERISKKRKATPQPFQGNKYGSKEKKEKEFKEPQQQSNVKIFTNYPPEWETGVVTNWPSM